MKTNDKEIQKLILQRFDRLEGKLDKLLEEVIPGLRTDMEVVKIKSNGSAKIIAGIGGAITLLVSVAAARWFK